MAGINRTADQFVVTGGTVAISNDGNGRPRIVTLSGASTDLWAVDDVNLGGIRTLVGRGSSLIAGSGATEYRAEIQGVNASKQLVLETDWPGGAQSGLTYHINCQRVDLSVVAGFYQTAILTGTDAYPFKGDLYQDDGTTRYRFDVTASGLDLYIGPTKTGTSETANTLALSIDKTTGDISTPKIKATQGGGNGQYNASVTARYVGGAFEFGHTNPEGYGSVIGSEVSSGHPYIAFFSGPGTAANTYKTLGAVGAVLKSDASGAFIFSKIPNANSDNQSPIALFAIDAYGALNTTAGFANGTQRSVVRAIRQNGAAAYVWGIENDESPILWQYNTSGAFAGSHKFNAGEIHNHIGNQFWHSGNFNPANYPRLPQVAAGVGQFIGILPGSNTLAVLPSGGTWAYHLSLYTAPGGVFAGQTTSVAAGGTTIASAVADYQWAGFAWRIS